MVRKYHKKAQGLSLNTIIVAAIGLAVLVILFAVFTGRIGLFNTGLDDAQKGLQKSCSAKCTASGLKGGSTPVAAGTCPSGADSRTVPSGIAETPDCCCTTS